MNCFSSDAADEELGTGKAATMQPPLVNKPQLQGMDPRKSYYAVWSAFWLDGTTDEKEGLEGIFSTEDEARACCEALIESYSNMDCWIYLLKPIGRIRRGPPKLKRFG